MKRIYQASDLQEAHLVAGLLANEGIEVRVLNENAQGALGEIPFGQAYPEIWIMDDDLAARAQQLVERYERGRRLPEAGVVECRRCGEPNPANFDLCWHCGAPLE